MLVARQEGGFPYKKAIVDTILVIIAKVPEAKEAGLGHLCEFIEDCEFTLLSTQILYLLGLEGPGTQVKTVRAFFNHRLASFEPYDHSADTRVHT